MSESFDCEDVVENYCKESDCRHNDRGYCELFDDVLGYEGCIFNIAEN